MEPPSLDDFSKRERFLFRTPFVKRSRSLAIGAGLGTVELDTSRHMKRAAEDNSLAGGEDRHLIEEPSRLHRDDAAEMVNVVRVLKPMADEIRALADDCRADFAWALAGYDQREAEFPTFFGDPLISQDRVPGGGVGATPSLSLPSA
ncbi:MAG: hypothetical protein HQL37_13715 [Alphaproteobacteria bacterium]|nr:hypothetical protein [Alphaproteobacteria bacterium]